MQLLATKLLSEQEVRAAEQKGLHLRCRAFTQQVPLDFMISAEQIQNYDGLIFTSQNAVKFFFDSHPLSLPNKMTFFCIDEKTKDSLLHYGIDLANIISDRSAHELANKIIQNNHRQLLHLCSKQKLDILRNRLLKAFIQYHYVEIYETRELSPQINIKDYQGVLFFSPSGVNSFLKNTPIVPEQFFCCIGESTATELRQYKLRNRILVSKRPTLHEMLNTILHHNPLPI